MLIVKQATANKRSRKVKKSYKHKEVSPDPLEDTRLTDEQYMKQIKKVQKRLPQYDIEEDCPDKIDKSYRNRSGIGLFLSRLFK